MNEERDIRRAVTEIASAAAAAARRSGRSPECVRVLAVTKTVPIDRIREAVAAGQRLFGENYVQEARKKIDVIRGESGGAVPEFHFIGRLQRNKAKDAVSLFDVIQTIERMETARAVNDAASKAKKVQRVFLQVNISREDSKSGVDQAAVSGLFDEMLRLECLSVEGLMCIGSYFEPNEADELRRSEFRAMRSIRDHLAARTGRALPELSMGMSHDFEAAIEEGATIVRVGTALFGDRPGSGEV